MQGCGDAAAFGVGGVQVTGPDGAPFAGAVVTLTGDSTVAKHVSDAQGGAAFEDVPDGRYTLGADGCGPGVAVTRAESGQVTRADIRLGSVGDGPRPLTLPEPRFSPESDAGPESDRRRP